MSSRQVVKALARQASKQQARLPVAARALSGAASGGGQARKSWVPADEITLRDTTRQAIVYQLTKVQVAVAEGIVPWFTATMPASYFRQVSTADQIMHMRSLSAQFNPETNDFIRAGRSRVSLQSLNACGELEVTLMDFSGNGQGLLASQFEELETGPPMGDLSRVKVFTSMDGKLAFNIFTFQGHENASKASASGRASSSTTLASLSAEQREATTTRIKDYAASLKDGSCTDTGLEWSESAFSEANLEAFLDKCPQGLVNPTGPRSFLQQKLLYDAVAGTEDLGIHIEPSNLLVSDEAHLVAPVEGTNFPLADNDAAVMDNGWWVKMAITNSVPLTSLKKILVLLKNRNVDVERMHLDNIDMGNRHKDTVSMARLLVSPPAEVNEGSEEEREKWFKTLAGDIKRLKWLDDASLDLSYYTVAGAEKVGVQRAEVITCLSSILTSLLSQQDVWAFSKTNIASVVRHPRYLRLAAGIADLFTARFDPVNPLPDSKYHAMRQQLRDEIENDVQEDAVAKEVLHRMVSVMDATRRTNLFLEDRYALSLRIDTESIFKGGHFQKAFNPTLHPDYDFSAGAFMTSSNDDGATAEANSSTSTEPVGDTPYGVFFVHGRRFNGFHVRFRDIARGGMRLVTPASTEQLAIESARHYDEAYNLASAQQLKNKDIPEGGSKCVVLIDSCSLDSPAYRELVMRKSVKAFTDSMLDLIVSTPTTAAGVVDYLGKQELVYLGPDEQVIPDDINWIVSRAGERGYPIPSAFMSSKPDAGINHKVYGVTSEGVQVFLDVALREMKMHPDQLPPNEDGSEGFFTVKMTGGPDGDVAGNMIKILQREYGDKCRVVGLADGTGCAEDPNGLCPAELLRLFKEELPLAAFDPELLSDDGKLYVCDPAKNVSAAAAEEALRARNTMHNRVIADAFIPAGGRPATMHIDNWKQFLRPDNGKPSSKLIVEGANLFLTPAARAAMHAETGIPIVKDSSANKCGVICSSFEIMSSMLLSDQEFANVKTELVEDVLVRLRLLAKREAELLFREFRSLPGSLPDFSQRISLAINRVTDAIADDLDEHTGGDYDSMMHLVKSHMPEKLTEIAGASLNERVPKEYLKRAIASTLASHVVYREGVQFVEQHREGHLGALAFDYLEAEKQVSKVLETLDQAWENGGKDGLLDEEVATTARQIVEDGGVRAYMGRHSGGFGGIEK